MGKSTISMAIFNSYVQLPEGIGFDITTIPRWPRSFGFFSQVSGGTSYEELFEGIVLWPRGRGCWANFLDQKWSKNCGTSRKPQHNMWKDLVIPWVLQVEILGVSSETARCSIVTDLCWRLVGFSWNDDQHPNKSIEYTAWFFCVYIKNIYNTYIHRRLQSTCVG